MAPNIQTQWDIKAMLIPNLAKIMGALICLAALSFGGEGPLVLPDIEGPLLGKKGVSSLKKNQGQLMLVDFWATWCIPCRKSIPKLQAMQEKYPQLKIVGINLDNSSKSAEKFMEKEGVKFTNIHDEKKKIADYYEVEGMPSIFLYDSSGKLLKRLDGYTEKDLTAMENEIEKILSQLSAK